jgi:integrase
MPSRYTKVIPIELNTRSSYIFVRKHNDKLTWALRVNLPDKRQVVRSLKIPYKSEDRQSENQAYNKGNELAEGIRRRFDDDLPSEEPSLIHFAIKFQDYAIEKYRANQELIDVGKEPVFKKSKDIDGGKGVWNRGSISTINSAMDNSIRPFFSRPSFINKPIHKINKRDIADFKNWREEESAKRDEPYAPATINRQNTVLRSVFRFAQHEGERFIPPTIQNQPQELRKRRRPEFSKSEYTQLLDYVRGRYADVRTPKQKYAYLYYHYLETLEHTGIRPFQNINNAIRMGDIQEKKNANGVMLLLERNEKNHIYTATASQYWVHSLTRLKRFYESVGITDDREYLFVHPQTINNRGINKGEPINSFNKQWKTAKKSLGWAGKGFTHYSIRHRYAGKRLMNKDVNPLDLANVMGTSLAMISEIYQHYQVEQHYDELVASDIDYRDYVDVFKDGIRERGVKKDSEEHKEIWEDSPEKLEVPPTDYLE